MSTFMANPQNIERKWYLVDAEGKTMGRLAADVATLLNGKHKVTYTPHQDCGDFVIVTNVEKMVLTGKKLDQKYYRTHSGFPGGLKEVKYDKLMATKPELALRLAVRGMLPKNSIGRASLNRLKLFRGAEHTHAAQKPEVFTK
ncbi:MAG: 50S ribosomal protein L13 [Clostridia bacterium]|nr:50S ribosomal protein L13 [Clostridia bacterium]